MYNYVMVIGKIRYIGNIDYLKFSEPGKIIELQTGFCDGEETIVEGLMSLDFYTLFEKEIQDAIENETTVGFKGHIEHKNTLIIDKLVFM